VCSSDLMRLLLCCFGRFLEVERQEFELAVSSP
jgi:hypothetical protein